MAKMPRWPAAWPRSKFLSAALGSGAAVLGLRAPGLSQGRATAFTGLRLIDGTGAPPIADAVLVVDDRGRVAAAGPRASVPIPAGATVVALSGATVMPALLDAHAHVGLLSGNTVSTDYYTADNVHAHLGRFAAHGVYAVQALGTDNDLIYDIRRDQSGETQIGEARIVTGGHGFGAPGGYPPPQTVGKFAYRPSSVAEARANVRELAAKKPDIVKLWVDDNFGRVPRIAVEIEKAIIDESHAQGLRVATHLFYLDDAKRLVASGVDVIAHSVRDRPLDAELVTAMKARGIVYVPNMTIDESHFIYADRPAGMSDPFFQRAMAPAVYDYLRSDAYRDKVLGDPDTPKWRAAAAMSKRNAGIAFQGGVTMAMGTDAAAAVERIIGFDAHRELELLVGVGISPLQAIRAATSGSAMAMGPRGREIGTLEPGKLANFLVLGGDPVTDIRNTRKIRQIWYHGQRAQTAALHRLHARDTAIVPVEQLFDSAHRHLRSICC
jgi:imidazolonepropionase-like amidohydrolase